MWDNDDDNDDGHVLGTDGGDGAQQRERADAPDGALRNSEDGHVMSCVCSHNKQFSKTIPLIIF